MYDQCQRLRAAEDKRQIKAAIDHADRNPESGHRFTSPEDMVRAAEATRAQLGTA